jgi:ribonuclease-3
MRHAMANCFEALMGAIYLDSGINEADKVFSKALFGTDKVKVKVLLFSFKG